MSEQDEPDEASAGTEDPEKTETPDDAENQPDINEDEVADIGDIADDVEAESGADADDDEDNDEQESETADVDQQDSDDLPAPSDSDGDSWGDLYVGTLTTSANVLIEEYGDEGETIDEDLARQQHLDEYFNDWMESRGKREDMPPEQALLISTAMFLVTVLGTKTDLFSQLLSEADFDL